MTDTIDTLEKAEDKDIAKLVNQINKALYLADKELYLKRLYS